MTWFTVVKMPNPFGGAWNTLTSSEYYKMDDKNKQNYHSSMTAIYQKQIKRAVEPRKAGQAPPLTDDQIRELRELFRFHSRQTHRLRFNINKENYYSLEEEINRKPQRPTYDAVERIPDTTKEMYDNYTREDKIAYWIRLQMRLEREYGKGFPAIKFAQKMANRMKANPDYTPPFEGDGYGLGRKESEINFRDTYRYRDISEYNDFTDDEKRKYHSRMASRAKKENKKDESRFHFRMINRINLNSNKDKYPLYPTLEAAKEAEEE